jgi:creatinine amidohydrolase
MKNILVLLKGFLILFLVPNPANLPAQDTDTDVLPVKYEELTSPDFIRAIERSGGTCIIPMGIMEKHGAHLPLGTDLMVAREMALRAARKEYTVVFPEYFVGQIFEAKHQPGTIAYSHETMWNLLDETCRELARNGMKKIILVNGHVGNNAFLQYFCQAQLDGKKDYCVVVFNPQEDPAVMEKVEQLRKFPWDSHAGDLETGMMLEVRPDIVHVDRAGEQSGADQARLSAVPNISTGIWWYARYPNHYAGDATNPSQEAAALLLEHNIELLAELVRTLKQNDDILELQDRFFREAEQPLNTEQ